MKNERLTTAIVIWLFIAAVGAGCSHLQTQKYAISGNELDQSNPQLDPNAKITKDVLRQRLSGKNIDFIETSLCNQPISGNGGNISEPRLLIRCDKPNPLTLEIRITKSYRDSFKARLNMEELDFDGLVSTLNSIFKQRETDGVFRDGSNEIEKRIQLGVTDGDIYYWEQNNITVGDFERLVDDLREKGIDEISVDFISSPKRDVASLSSSNPAVKAINVGVVNKKAVKLVKPDYPAAASAVKASGSVNVIVTIDEQGNVISAKAAGGHLLLRTSAERAALASKFSVTMIAGKPARVSGIIVYDFTPPKVAAPTKTF